MNVVQLCVARAIQGVIDRYRPNVVSIDTETTGLRGAVIQAAAIEMTPYGSIADCLSGLIRPPDGIRLEPGAVRVHGITQTTIDTEAEPAMPFLDRLLDYLEHAHSEGKPIVAHNSAFDVARINDTMKWHGSKRRLEVPIMCTMRESKRRCGLTTTRGTLKNPSNSELYLHLTGRDASEDVKALHDARTDATITAWSFVEGRRRRWW